MCKKAHKIAHPIQKPSSMLKWVRFWGENSLLKMSLVKMLK